MHILNETKYLIRHGENDCKTRVSGPVEWTIPFARHGKNGDKLLIPPELEAVLRNESKTRPTRLPGIIRPFSKKPGIHHPVFVFDFVSFSARHKIISCCGIEIADFLLRKEHCLGEKNFFLWDSTPEKKFGSEIEIVLAERHPEQSRKFTATIIRNNIEIIPGEHDMRVMIWLPLEHHQ